MIPILIADSGSTKTDWRLLTENGQHRDFSTSGINPYVDSRDSILSSLQNEIPWDNSILGAGKLFYYGAGASSIEKQHLLAAILSEHFGISKIQVQGDLLAAAIGLFGQNPGMVCILGTGSSSCYYDGTMIHEQQPSLGYIAGDEGSGNYMGKRILQYYTYGTFDDELRMGFELRFGNDVRKIINKLYHEPYPNRYLASFVSLLHENRGHYMVENIVEDSINDFFQTNLLKYRQAWNSQIGFAGSVAFHFRDVLANICDQYELDLGPVIKSPMDGLAEFHTNNPV